jgi:hypothetical protein
VSICTARKNAASSHVPRASASSHTSVTLRWFSVGVSIDSGVMVVAREAGGDREGTELQA